MTAITLSIEEQKMKLLLKEALIDLLVNQQELFRDLFAEVVEEVGLIQAIKEGESSEIVSRDVIFELLGEPA
jgi:hypothetical protein